MQGTCEQDKYIDSQSLCLQSTQSCQQFDARLGSVNDLDLSQVRVPDPLLDQLLHARHPSAAQNNYIGFAGNLDGSGLHDGRNARWIARLELDDAEAGTEDAGRAGGYAEGRDSSEETLSSEREREREKEGKRGRSRRWTADKPLRGLKHRAHDLHLQPSSIRKW